MSDQETCSTATHGSFLIARSLPITCLAHHPLPLQARRQYFLKGVAAPDISATAVAWSWDDFGKPQLWAALISFLYLDFLDTTGEKREHFLFPCLVLHTLLE